jgi:hypothetical protein
MNKIYMVTRRFRKDRSPYMAVLPSDMWRVRRAYEDMRKSGVDSLDARTHVYRLLSTGATARSSVEIENEERDERFVKAF